MDEEGRATLRGPVRTLGEGRAEELPQPGAEAGVVENASTGGQPVLDRGPGPVAAFGLHLEATEEAQSWVWIDVEIPPVPVPGSAAPRRP